MYFGRVRAVCTDSAVFIANSDNYAFVKNKKRTRFSVNIALILEKSAE